MIVYRWHNGANHLIFNMIAGAPPYFNPVLEVNMGNALIVGADFDTYTYRTGFDIVIPVFSTVSKQIDNIIHKRYKIYQMCEQPVITECILGII